MVQAVRQGDLHDLQAGYSVRRSHIDDCICCALASARGCTRLKQGVCREGGCADVIHAAGYPVVGVGLQVGYLGRRGRGMSRRVTLSVTKPTGHWIGLARYVLLALSKVYYRPALTQLDSLAVHASHSLGHSKVPRYLLPEEFVTSGAAAYSNGLGGLGTASSFADLVYGLLGWSSCPAGGNM